MTARVSRHASKKAPSTINIISRLCSFSNNTEAEFDQTTNYSLLYAEENSIIEEIDHFEYLGGSCEQENTITTYYTEGTPFETPLHFSTSTSTSDLLKIDDIKISNVLNEESKRYIPPHQIIEIIKELERQKVRSQLKSYMEFRNKEQECKNTFNEIYLSEDLEDFDDKSEEDRLEKIINVTPSQSPVELCNKDGKNVTFVEDHYTEQTPLMFSRCSSLGSLSGCEQQSLQDDRSSVVSDFSRTTSEVVSPSELPDSPAQLILSTNVQPKDKKYVKKKIQQQKDKNQSPESSSQKELSKCNIFEDDFSVYKEESTPIKFQSVAESSLSSLTIDDEDEVEETGAIKTLKTPISNHQLNNINESEKKNITTNIKTIRENCYLSKDEEKILDDCIRKGIAKVTGQNINDVSSFNLPTDSYHEDESKEEKPYQSICRTNNSLDENIFDQTSDLTDEEEQLLDEYIRKGIAKVTGQNINEITSLSLKTNFSGVSKLNSFDDNSTHKKCHNLQQEHINPKRADLPNES